MRVFSYAFVKNNVNKIITKGHQEDLLPLILLLNGLS